MKDAGRLAAGCNIFDSRFLRHASHSPAGPRVPPQAHLRCSSPPGGMKLETAAEFGAVFRAFAFNRSIIAYSCCAPARSNRMYNCVAFERLWVIGKRGSSLNYAAWPCSRELFYQPNSPFHTLLGITAGISINLFCDGTGSTDRPFKGTPDGDSERLLDTRTNFERRLSFRFVAHVARRFFAACADRIDIAALRFCETLARKRHPVVVVVAARFQSGCAVVVTGENGSELAAWTGSAVYIFCFSFALETILRIAANPLRACNQIRAAPFRKNSAITGCYFLLRGIARGRFLWIRRIPLLPFVILC
jgi:hypothetical protein